MTKQIPILFSTMMVQANIDGRKTNTRRTRGLEVINKNPDLWKFEKLLYNENVGLQAFFSPTDKNTTPGWYGVKCPYGKPGDILWVRENWQIHSWDFEDGTINIKYANGDIVECVMRDEFNNSPFTAEWLQFQLDAMAEKGIMKVVDKDGNETSEDDEIFYQRTGKKQPFKPSIHMPKEAARIWLKVKSVRVERLQDISPDDAIAEGIQSAECDPETRTKCISSYCKEACNAKGTYYNYPTDFEDEPCYSALESFEQLWKMINGKDSWQSNPFVWVVEFEVLSITSKPETI